MAIASFWASVRSASLFRLGEVGEAGGIREALAGPGVEAVELGKQVIPRRVRQPALQQPVDEAGDLRVAGARCVRGRQDALRDRVQRSRLVLGEDRERGRLAAGFLLVEVDMGEVGIREQFRRQQRQGGCAADHLEGAAAADGAGWRTG